MAGYTHRINTYHTLRRGPLAGVTVLNSFPVCSYADAVKAGEALRRGLDVVEQTITPCTPEGK